MDPLTEEEKEEKEEETEEKEEEKEEKEEDRRSSVDTMPPPSSKLVEICLTFLSYISTYVKSVDHEDGDTHLEMVIPLLREAAEVLGWEYPQQGV